MTETQREREKKKIHIRKMECVTQRGSTIVEIRAENVRYIYVKRKCWGRKKREGVRKYGWKNPCEEKNER